jgi:hypothetical protein
MTDIDTKKPPAHSGAAKVEPAAPDDRRPAEPPAPLAASREDPFALDPLSPPSGRPW